MNITHVKNLLNGSKWHSESFESVCRATLFKTTKRLIDMNESNTRGRTFLGSRFIKMALLAGMLFPGISLRAGDEVSGKEPLILNDETPALVTPTIESRLRYEFGEQDGLDDSHSGTWRNRIGILTRDISGFQLFAEYEGTLTVDRDSYNAAGVHGPSSKTVIADPESHELNQLWGSYTGLDGFLNVKAGRQAINLDGQRFVGTVGWRQNMQTFDAAAVTLKPTDDLEIYYGYLWKVNRIFGSEVEAGPTTDFIGNSHLVNAKYKGLPLGTLTTYAYFLDLHNDGGDANSNNTFGVSLAGDLFSTDLDYYAEYAYQTDAFDSPLSYGAHYAHGSLSAPIIEDVKATVGLEYLGSDNGVGFKTPLATLHKFNGFADRFLVSTPGNGLTDLYGSIGFKLPFGFGGSVFYHHFWDDDFGTSFGNEVDLVLTKSLGKGVTLLVKGALFAGESGQPDVNRATVELNYKF